MARFAHIALAACAASLLLAGCSGESDEERLYVHMVISNSLNDKCGPNSDSPMATQPCGLEFEDGRAELLNESGEVVATSEQFRESTGGLMSDGWRADLYSDPLPEGEYTLNIPDCGEIELRNSGSAEELTPDGPAEDGPYVVKDIGGGIDVYAAGPPQCGLLYEK